MKIILPFIPRMFTAGLFRFGVENASATDLGGGTPAGNEPDIFEGVGDEGGTDSGGSEGDESGEDAVGEGASEGSEGSEGEGEGSGEGTGEGGEVEGEGDGAGGEGDKEAEVEGDKGADEAGKTPEQIAADKKATDDAAKAAAAKRPQTEEEKAIEKTLQEAYREAPKLKEALAKYPELRAPFFKAAQLNKIFPTIKEAEKSKDWAMQLFNIDKLYFGQTIDNKKALQKLLWDENLDADGKSTGHYEQLQELFTSDTLQHLEAAITQNPTIAAAVAAGFKPEQATVAIEVVRRLIAATTGRPLSGGAGVGGRPGNAAVASIPVDTTNMTPREKQLAEENARYKSQIESANRTSAEAAEASFNQNTFGLFWEGTKDNPGVKAEVDKRIPPSIKENQFYSEAFANRVLQEVHKALRADEFFDAQLEAASRAGDRGPQHQAEIADMLKQRAALLIPTITRQVADLLKPKVKAAAAAGSANNKEQNRGRGNERPRREPALGSTPGRLQKPGARSSGKVPAHQSGMKTTGDYNRDADKILGLDE